MTGENHYLGIDLGGTTIKLAVISAEGEITASSRIATDGEDGHDAVIARMIESAAALLAEYPETSIDAIGVAVPGVIDMVD